MSSTQAAADERGSGLDQVAYWLTIVGVYFLIGVLFFYSGKGKLFDDDGHAPAPLKEQFKGTFIEKVPGVDTAWVMIGIMELAIFLLIVLSIVRGEFLPRRGKLLLLIAVALALVNFACLSFGQTSTGNNAGTASLYSYFGSTAVVFLLVLKLPPNAPMNWLSARLRPRA